MTDIDFDDTEYTTPAQAAEIRRMKAELPLWTQVDLDAADAKAAQLGELLDAAIDDRHLGDEIKALESRNWQRVNMPIVQGVITPETTIDAAQVQKDVEAPANVSSGFSADTIAAAKMLMSVLADTPSDVTAQLLADTELHRALNGTTGMESEE